MLTLRVNILALLALIAHIGIGTYALELSNFHDHESLSNKLQELRSQFPNIVHIYSLEEKSVSGRYLQVIQIGPHAGKPRPLLTPMVKYVANMHGNEVIGREMLLALAEYLVTEYTQGNPRITQLLDTIDLHLLPTANPDGFARSVKGVCRGYSHDSGRTNDNGIDLNRNFPDWDLVGAPEEVIFDGREPETRALMRWILDNPFVLSINFHDGAVVANYPYDDSRSQSNGPSLTPDNEFFTHLALVYARNHAFMYKGSGLCESDNFPNGITNGADWYIVKGGLQDFNYLYSNCFEITLELSCCKYPNEENLAAEWSANRESLLSYLEQVHSGVKGVILDKEGNPVPDAKVHVKGIDKPVVTSKDGEYWRLLTPGSYEVKAQYDGFESDWTPVQVLSLNQRASHWQSPTRLDLILERSLSPVKSSLSHDELNFQPHEPTEPVTKSCSNLLALYKNACYCLPYLCNFGF